MRGSLELPLANMYLRHHSVPRSFARRFGSKLKRVQRERMSSALSLRISSSSVLVIHRMRDVQLAEWSKEDIATKNQRKLITDGDDVVANGETGLLVSSRAYPGPVARVLDNDKGASK